MAGRRIHDAAAAIRGWFALQRARSARLRHPGLGEVSEYCFYAVRLRFGDLAFDIGANHGRHTRPMLIRGARVVAVEPQADLADDLARRFNHRLTVLPVAVGEAAGRALLFIPTVTRAPRWIPTGNQEGYPIALRDSGEVDVISR